MAHYIRSYLYVVGNAACIAGVLEQGRNHGWKVEGDQGLGLNTGARPAKGRAGCWVREGVAPPAVRVRGRNCPLHIISATALIQRLWLVSASQRSPYYFFYL